MRKQMLSDLAIRNLVYASNLIDRTFYSEKNNKDLLKNLKFAKKLYLRINTVKWKHSSYKDIVEFFKNKQITSSGVVAIPHRNKKILYTQYCAGLICKSKKLGVFEVDIDFYIHWNLDFTLKR